MFQALGGRGETAYWFFWAPVENAVGFIGPNNKRITEVDFLIVMVFEFMIQVSQGPSLSLPCPPVSS